jgi:twitching motility protein PilI
MSVHPVTQLRRYDEAFKTAARSLPGGQIDAGVIWRAIAFRIGDTQLAASMVQVREVLTDPLVSRVPGSKTWVRELANVRGRLVTIIDFPLFLRIERGARALFVESGDLSVGLLVDEVFGARQFSEDERSTDLGDTIDAMRPYVSSRIVTSGEPWTVLDIARVLSAPAFLNAAA